MRGWGSENVCFCPRTQKWGKFCPRSCLMTPNVNLFSRRKPMTSKAMKLVGKSKDVDSFVDQLKSEGQHVSSETTMSSVTGKKTAIAPAGQPQIKTERYVARTELHS